MSLRHTLILAGIGFAFTSGCATNQDAPSELFAAMIMTKEQQASSTPTDSGVLLHDTSSGTWKRIGPKVMIILSAVADPSDPKTMFFACGNGIVRTKDGGESWRLVTGWRESDVLQIAIDPEDGNSVYAASCWGVTVSRDGGDTWSASNTGLPEYFSKGIVLDHLNTNRLLLATTTGLFQSKDRAKSWKRVKSFPETAVLRLRRSASDANVWIAGTEGIGVWISKDDGKSWKASATALKTANVYAVAIHPENSSMLAAGGWDTGVYISSDGGNSWSLSSKDLPSQNITSMVFDENTPNRLWVSTFEEGTYYSDDSGQTWESGNLYGAYVYDLGFLPAITQ